MIHGPGCPVCVLPIGRIDLAIGLALEQGVILCSYGDPLRVPASNGLLPVEGEGARRRRAHGLFDQRCPPSIAREQSRARSGVPRHRLRDDNAADRHAESNRPVREVFKNLSVLCNHVLTPSAITHILQSPEVREYGTLPLDGFIGPCLRECGDRSSRPDEHSSRRSTASPS